jgi:two-component system cell cycle response regulator
MPRRILLADESEAVAATVRKLVPALEIEAVAPVAAAERAAVARFDLAIVRGTAGARVLAAVRAADPLLPVIALFLDRREAKGGPGRAGADAVLVGPLNASAVGAACTLAAELRLRGERIAELEARVARTAGPARELEFLKRLLLTEVKRSRRYGYPIALALLAVDEVAPTPGTRARSARVAEVLGLVTGALRDIDVAVPFSDERLLVLMPHTKDDGALRVARRLCALVRERPRPPRLTASAGVAAHGGDGTVSFAALVRRASDALARARAAGGDRAEAADPPKRRDRISIG